MTCSVISSLAKEDEEDHVPSLHKRADRLKRERGAQRNAGNRVETKNQAHAMGDRDQDTTLSQPLSPACAGLLVAPLLAPSVPPAASRWALCWPPTPQPRPMSSLGHALLQEVN